MVKRNIDIIKYVFDLLIIFSPFIMLFDGGLNKFLVIFYLIYLPSLIVTILEMRYKKDTQLFKKSVPMKSNVHQVHKKTKSSKKELIIS
jgi:hypothetical protein